MLCNCAPNTFAPSHSSATLTPYLIPNDRKGFPAFQKVNNTFPGKELAMVLEYDGGGGASEFDGGQASAMSPVTKFTIFSAQDDRIIRSVGAALVFLAGLANDFTQRLEEQGTGPF